MSLRRRGYLLIELGIAVVILGSLMTVVATMLIHASHWRRESQNRALAALEASSLLEQCVGLPRSEVTQEKLTALAQARQAEALLPDESVDVSLQDALGAAKGQRIAVEIRWKTPTGNPQGPLRLATWIFDPPR